ncbi:MAG: hypothetical protein IPJ82_22960 [Lewinellaceae bacterium]|nr:hypothetical protein [Lewinellaceae bacterium]
MKESPAWAEFIFQLYQTRFEELLQVVTDVHFKNTDDRIVELLREKARMFGSRVIEITRNKLPQRSVPHGKS